MKSQRPIVRGIWDECAFDDRVSSIATRTAVVASRLPRDRPARHRAARGRRHLARVRRSRLRDARASRVARVHRASPRVSSDASRRRFARASRTCRVSSLRPPSPGALATRMRGETMVARTPLASSRADDATLGDAGVASASASAPASVPTPARTPATARARLSFSTPATTPVAPKSAVKTPASGLKVPGHGDLCAVCYSPLDREGRCDPDVEDVKRELFTTECGHVFHRCCLVRCREADFSTCPMCRAPLPSGSHRNTSAKRAAQRLADQANARRDAVIGAAAPRAGCPRAGPTHDQQTSRRGPRRSKHHLEEDDEDAASAGEMPPWMSPPRHRNRAGSAPATPARVGSESSLGDARRGRPTSPRPPTRGPRRRGVRHRRRGTSRARRSLRRRRRRRVRHRERVHPARVATGADTRVPSRSASARRWAPSAASCATPREARGTPRRSTDGTPLRRIEMYAREPRRRNSAPSRSRSAAWEATTGEKTRRRRTRNPNRRRSRRRSRLRSRRRSDRPRWNSRRRARRRRARRERRRQRNRVRAGDADASQTRGGGGDDRRGGGGGGGGREREEKSGRRRSEAPRRRRSVTTTGKRDEDEETARSEGARDDEFFYIDALSPRGDAVSRRRRASTGTRCDDTRRSGADIGKSLVGSSSRIVTPSPSSPFFVTPSPFSSLLLPFSSPPRCSVVSSSASLL